MTPEFEMAVPRRRRSFGPPLAALLLFLTPACCQAFWLLGFSPAPTLAPGRAGFISGTGAQFTRVGSPGKSSFTAALPHAGLRVGLTDRLDLGYRLCQVPLPFTSVAPTLGSEFDLKFRLTNAESSWQSSMVVGGAYAYLSISDQSKRAWSPGTDLVLSRDLSPRLGVFGELRYVYTAVPSAPGGEGANHVHSFGPAAGVKWAWTPQVSIVPEAGAFGFRGELGGKAADGFGVQVGVVLSVGGLPALW